MNQNGGQRQPGETEPSVNRAVIIGVGLMGGSLGLSIRSRKLAAEVLGVDTPGVLAAAVQRGAIDYGSTDIAEAVHKADLVFIATPIHTVCDVITAISNHLPPQSLVSDLASVKSGIVKHGCQLLGDRFIGGHPMAGSEITGINAARGSLFENAAWAITPGDISNPGPVALDRLSNLIRTIGAKPLVMSAERHDRAAALVSHLPHLVSFAYNRAIENDEERNLALELAAGSYRDFTRVAASDPILWRDVFLENRDWLLSALAAFKQSIDTLEKSVISGDADNVLKTILAASTGQPGA